MINPLIARRLYSVENSIRDNKSDPIDARELCGIARTQGEKLLALYRFRIKPEQFCSAAAAKCRAKRCEKA